MMPESCLIWLCRQDWAGQGEDEDMEEVDIDQDAAEPSIEEGGLMPTEEQAAFQPKPSRWVPAGQSPGCPTP